LKCAVPSARITGPEENALPARTRTLAAPLLAAASVALACTLDVQTIRYPDAAELPPRAPDCEVRMLDWYRVPRKSCVELADVSIGNRGWTFFECGQEPAEEAIRSEACRVGADTALVRRVKDFHAACYQARARLLRCEDHAETKGP
jgi:hypothetical protein